MPQDTDLISSLAAPLNELRRKRIVALLLITVGLVGTALVSYYAIVSGGLLALVLIGVAIALFWGVMAVFEEFKKAASNLIIPPLAETVGLRYQARASENRAQNWAETGLLPSGLRVSRAEDGFSGDFAGRSFWTADLRIVTNGKSAHTEFNGLVVSLDLAQPHHKFVLVKERDTTGGFFKRVKVGTKNLVRTTGHGSTNDQRFYAFVPDAALADDPAFQRRMDTLVRLDCEIPKCKLFSVVCTGKKVLAALSHKTDFFRLRVLLGTGNLPEELHRVLAEMQAILNVADILLASEAGVSPDADSAPPKASGAAPEAG